MYEREQVSAVHARSTWRQIPEDAILDKFLILCKVSFIFYEQQEK
jgi:hypothetical protein